MLHLFAHLVACCCAKFATGQTFSQRLPTFLLFPDHQSEAQQCWIRFHNSSNIVGAMHAHYAWLLRLKGCILSTMHCRSQTCWELLHPSAHHCQHAWNNSQHHWTNNVTKEVAMGQSNTIIECMSLSAFPFAY